MKNSLKNLITLKELKAFKDYEDIRLLNTALFNNGWYVLNNNFIKKEVDLNE